MARLGTVTLQTMDNSDLFLKEEVFLDGVTDPSEVQFGIQEPGFEAGKAWETGSVPSRIPVLVEGDASVITGWFSGDVQNFNGAFRIQVYIEFEEPDELFEIKEKEEEQ